MVKKRNKSIEIPKRKELSSWDKLNMHQKYELMQIYISHGIKDLDSMRKSWNEFKSGGNVYDGNNPNGQELKYNSSYAGQIGYTPIYFPVVQQNIYGNRYPKENEIKATSNTSVTPQVSSFGASYGLSPLNIRDRSSSEQSFDSRLQESAALLRPIDFFPAYLPEREIRRRVAYLNDYNEKHGTSYGVNDYEKVTGQGSPRHFDPSRPEDRTMLRQIGLRAATEAVMAGHPGLALASDGLFRAVGQGLRRISTPNFARQVANAAGKSQLQMTKDRLLSGGAERLGISNDVAQQLYTQQPIKGTTAQVNSIMKTNSIPSDLGVQRGNNYSSLFDDAWRFPDVFKSNANKMKIADIVEGHEFAHLLNRSSPAISTGASNSSFLKPIRYIDPPPANVFQTNSSYLRGKHQNIGLEQAARGTQIKNYFGLKEGQKLTGDMLRYAEKNYVKDVGFDNDMTKWFNGIKDFDKYAKWINRWSPLLIPPFWLTSEADEN